MKPLPLAPSPARGGGTATGWRMATSAGWLVRGILNAGGV